MPEPIKTANEELSFQDVLDRHNNIFYMYNDLKCLNVTDVTSKADDTIVGVKADFLRADNTRFSKVVYGDHGENIRQFLKNDQKFDLVMRGYIDASNSLKTTVHCSDQSKVAKFNMPKSPKGMPMVQMTLSTGHRDTVKNEKGFITPFTKQNGVEGVRILAFLNTNKSNEEICNLVNTLRKAETPEGQEFVPLTMQDPSFATEFQRLRDEEKILPSDMSRSMPVTLFMHKTEFQKVSNNFGHTSTLYSVNVPLKDFGNGLHRFNDRGQIVTEGGRPQIKLNITADAFSKFLAKDGNRVEDKVENQAKYEVQQSDNITNGAVVFLNDDKAPDIPQPTPGMSM